MASGNKIIFTFVIFATIIGGGSCISCFYCNSANNSACMDLSLYDGETVARMIPIVDCNTASPVPMDFFCRKIMQTIYHPKHEPEVRVTRGCGWELNQNNRECYPESTHDHFGTVCQCFNDYCNSADSADPASSVILFIVFATVLYFYR